MSDNQGKIERNILEMRWNTIRQQVRRQWGRLTDSDLDEIQGDVERLKTRVQERYECPREEAEEAVQAFVDQYNTYYDDDVSRPMVGG